MERGDGTDLALPGVVKAAMSVIRALGRFHTYNLRRNPMLCLGILWGGAAGFLSVALASAAVTMGPGKGLRSLPSPLLIALFLAHPTLLGLLLGAVGTVWREERTPSSAGASGLTDTATGLYSPEYMMHQLRHALARVSRTAERVTIVILETMEEGDDRALAALGAAARPYLRHEDILGRLGQGRLLLIVHGTLPCALCLVNRVAEMVFERTHRTVRAGVARWPEDGRVPADLIGAADLVLKASWNVGHAQECDGAGVAPGPLHRTSA